MKKTIFAIMFVALSATFMCSCGNQTAPATTADTVMVDTVDTVSVDTVVCDTVCAE